MQNANKIFSLLFIGLLLSMGAIDAVHHGITLAGDPRRRDFGPLPNGQVPVMGPWSEDVHIVRHTYGDLSHVGRLIPFRHEVAETLSSDSFGFRNPGYREGEDYDAVILGDCFLEGSDGELFHRHLEKASGLRVYNYHGRRPKDFFADPRFAKNKPRFLIVERIERGFDSHYFDEFLDPKPLPQETLSKSELLIDRFSRWGNVVSQSVFVEAMQWGVASLRYRLEDRLPGSVPLLVPSLGMLFIHEEPWAHGESLEKRGLPKVLEALASLDSLCRTRDIRLIVLMVPDKYSIYGQWASGRETIADLGDVLRPALNEGLRQRGILYADVFPLFKSRAGLDQPLLYELDDTRWTSLAKKLAAEEFHRQLPMFTNVPAQNPGGGN